MEAARQTPPGARPNRNDVAAQASGPSGPVIRVGCLTRRVTGVPEEWPSRLRFGRRPYKTRLTGRLICQRGLAEKTAGPPPIFVAVGKALSGAYRDCQSESTPNAIVIRKKRSQKEKKRVNFVQKRSASRGGSRPLRPAARLAGWAALSCALRVDMRDDEQARGCSRKDCRERPVTRRYSRPCPDSVIVAPARNLLQISPKRIFETDAGLLAGDDD